MSDPTPGATPLIGSEAQAAVPAEPGFHCYICAAPSTKICRRCTRDSCENHVCERCGRCSDCCACS